MACRGAALRAVRGSLAVGAERRRASIAVPSSIRVTMRAIGLAGAGWKLGSCAPSTVVLPTGRPCRAARPTGGAKREPGVPGWMWTRCQGDRHSAPPSAARLDPIEPSSAGNARWPATTVITPLLNLIIEVNSGSAAKCQTYLP